MRAGQLPIISALGLNEKDEETFKFGHMSYQEYLTGREYYQRLTTANFDVATVTELFDEPPADAFAEVRHHLMLQLLETPLVHQLIRVFRRIMNHLESFEL